MGSWKTFTGSKSFGHALAVFTTLVWGVTFVCTKVLLEDFTPFEIMVSRFTLAFVALCVISPHILRLRERKHELLFAAAGLTGVIGYFMIENTALGMTTASNVSIAVDTVPMFIAIIATIMGMERALTRNFIIGFIVAMLGVVLIAVPTGFGLEDASAAAASAPFPGAGELLAICAACTWGVYSNIVAKLDKLGYETVPMTKRIFLWGVVFAVVLSPVFGFRLDFARYLNPVYAGNLLFLGLVASGLCFITWGKATSIIGPSKAGIYLMLQPATTCLFAFLFIGEAITGRMVGGVALVLLGLLLAQGIIRLWPHRPQQTQRVKQAQRPE